MYKFVFTFLLCTLFAGCSDDDDAPRYVPQKLISQIRIKRADQTQQYDFKYDNRQRIKQHIETKADGSQFTCETFEYTYAINRIYVDCSGGENPARYTLYTNKVGCAEKIVSENKATTTLTYNSNGYYYEKPSLEAWTSYEYRMIGEQCNLDKIIKYNSATAAGVQSKEFDVAIEYSTVSNTTILDVSYFLVGNYSNTSTQQLPLSLFGWMGKRSFMMPSSLQETSYTPNTTATHKWLYTYETNTDGFITRIHAVESNNEAQSTEYTITYI
ncbi:MAG: hypothetical protein RRZ83_05325 [Alistipes sp.]